MHIPWFRAYRDRISGGTDRMLSGLDDYFLWCLLRVVLGFIPKKRNVVAGFVIRSDPYSNLPVACLDELDSRNKTMVGN